MPTRRLSSITWAWRPGRPPPARKSLCPSSPRNIGRGSQPLPIKPYPYDPEKAKKLLAEAGYAKGFDFVLSSPADRYLKDKEVAEAVAGYLRKAGINASVRFHEWGNYIKQIIMGHKADPSYLLGWGDTTYDADFTLWPLLRSGRPISTYSNPQVDALIDQGQISMDKKKRQKIYSDALKLIHEDVPFAWCYQQVDIYGVNERVNWKACE
jgi:peptide/nickel transport system substrate-binding protein